MGCLWNNTRYSVSNSDFDLLNVSISGIYSADDLMTIVVN